MGTTHPASTRPPRDPRPWVPDDDTPVERWLIRETCPPPKRGDVDYRHRPPACDDEPSVAKDAQRLRHGLA
jgi:hypothetical protein